MQLFLIEQIDKNVFKTIILFLFVNLISSLVSGTKLIYNLFQSGWSIPVELVIGPQQGISYMTDSAVQVPHYILYLNAYYKLPLSLSNGGVDV